MFAYCYNNPVNYFDSTGEAPKWLKGFLTVVSGVTQMMAGAVIGATAGWTGIGAAVATFLLVNGAATVVSGAAQMHNDFKGTNYCEENQVRLAAQAIDEILWGSSEINVVSGYYDAANTLATIYSVYGGYGRLAGEISNMYQIAAPTITSAMQTAVPNLRLPDFVLKCSDVIGGFADTLLTKIQIFEG